MQLGRKNIQLVVGDEVSDEFLSLPVARVIRDSSGSFVYDPAFIPPCLKISASEQLFGMLQRLVEILEEKSTAVSHDQHLEGGKFKVGLSARHIAQFWFLHAVNSSLSPLRHLLLSKHGHPEELFREMLRLGGRFVLLASTPTLGLCLATITKTWIAVFTSWTNTSAGCWK